MSYLHKDKRTYEERVKEYLEWPIDVLARKLVDLEIQEELRRPIMDSDFEPCEPFTAKAVTCKTWADCTNPFHDCLNCPLRFTTGASFSCTGGYVHETKSNDVNF